MEHTEWPPLAVADWEPTYLTLHRWIQVVGKVRLALSPPVNHWWHVALYVTPVGLTTSILPTRSVSEGFLTIAFDFVAHELSIDHSGGKRAGFALAPMSVAEFYERTMAALRSLGEDVSIWPVPVEVTDRTPFNKDRAHAQYDRVQVERFHRILLSVQGVFSSFRGEFFGKCSPVHLFWGALDLAVTRFSGRRNPTPPKDRVMALAYSHEVISHGFWPGGDWPMAGRVDQPIFYAYAVPEPDGFARAAVQPAAAHYSQELHEFVLPYDAVRRAADPARELRAFLQSTYEAGARAARWPREELDGEPVLLRG